MNSLLQAGLLYLKNFPGHRLREKICVIECDDWGGIRMPSKEVYQEIKSQNLTFNDDHFDRLDSLESKEDMEALFDILSRFKDKAGRNAVMTPFVNVANPAYPRIRLHEFREYYWENYSETILRYNGNLHMLALWKQGIEENMFVPEYHGREHLCVPVWLKKLQVGNKSLIRAFDLGYCFPRVSDINPVASGFRAQFYFDNPAQKPFLIDSISHGVELFKEAFGYTPVAFVPGNGVFHPDFETELISAGIRFMSVNHIMPVPDGKGGITIKRNYVTKKKNNGLTHYLRNCAFEPSGPNYKGIGLTLKQIESAFFWNKPAIISTHRVNFVGGMNEDNRTHGLNELNLLLKEVMKRWPDVLFLSTRELFTQYYD